MKAVSSINSAAGMDKSTSVAASGQSQDAAGDSGFLAMLDGLIQTMGGGQLAGQGDIAGHAGQTAGQKAGQSASDAAGQDASAQDLLPPPKAASAKASPPEAGVAAAGGLASSAASTVAPVAGHDSAALLALSSSLQPTTAVKANAAAINNIAPDGDIAVSAAISLRAIGPALSAVAAGPTQPGLIAATKPATPETSLVAQSAVSAAQPQTASVHPVIIGSAASHAPASVSVAITALPVLSVQDAIATTPSALTGDKPAETGDVPHGKLFDHGVDAQQSAIIAALFSQGQAQPPVAALNVASGAHAAGHSSVSGAGASPGLPSPAGNGIAFGLTLPPGASAGLDDSKASAGQDSVKTSTFGIGESAQPGAAAQTDSPGSSAGDGSDASHKSASPASADQLKPQEIANLFATAPLPIIKPVKLGTDNIAQSNGIVAGAPALADNGFAGLTLVHQQGIIQGAHGAGTVFATSATMNSTPADQVSIVMQRAASNGEQSMTISLDPVELGKVEVKLDFARDGTVQASIVADRPDTLTLLKNDHHTLTQALQNAGLSADSSSLSFNLRDGTGSQGRQSQQSSQNGSTYHTRADAADADSQPSLVTSSQYTVSSGSGRVDVFA